WGVNYYSDIRTPDSSEIKDIVESGMLHRLIDLSFHEDRRIAIPVLRVIGNISAGDNAFSTTLVNRGLLAHLRSLVSQSDAYIVKEAIWIVSNIAASYDQHRLTILQNGLLDDIMRNLRVSKDAAVVKECTWALLNMCTSSDQTILQGVVTDANTKSLIAAICRLNQVRDEKTLYTCIEVLEHFLEQGESLGLDENPVVNILEEDNNGAGLDRLEELQSAPSEGIYTLVSHIIQYYFGEEDEEYTE
ncbi:hypothetical protein KIPB_002033, partial [Kipferlia bialata]